MCARPQIETPQISAKYCTTLSTNIRLLKMLLIAFCFAQILTRALYSLFVTRESMYLQTCGSLKFEIKACVRKLQIPKLQIRKSQQRLGPQKQIAFAEDPQI
jgi:hypothetical protein